jgi:predicted AlkP superfamily phosphohydrolase/phosphomutase
MMNGADKRLLVVALDGATFDLIRPLVARGELPFIASMMKRGWSGPLLSTVPPITPAAWSSFATGTSPEEHGVFGFNYPDARDYSLRLTTAADLQRATLWQRLSRRGIRVLLLDVPFTFPPEPVNGCMVAGFPVPAATAFTHPPDLADRLESAGIPCLRHPAEVPDPAGPDFLAWLDKFLSDRLEIFRHLTSRELWQFAMVGTMALDWAQHALWRYFDPRFVFAGEPEAAERRQALFACYRRIDRFAADLADLAGDGTGVLLLSDHGFGTTLHYDWISEALANAGLLYWHGEGGGLAATVGAAALRTARSSPRLQRWGKRWLGDTTTARAWARRARAFSRIDWQRTRVFPAGDYHLNLYVNSRSRFARGIVGDGADYEKTLNDAAQALESFRAPRHNQPLVRRLARIEGGAKKLPTRVPDLSLELTVLPISDKGVSSGPLTGICGFHAPEGIAVLDATAWLGSVLPAQMEIADLAPAILRGFGISIAEEKSVEPSRTPQVLSTEQSVAVLDALRHLGYLD